MFKAIYYTNAQDGYQVVDEDFKEYTPLPYTEVGYHYFLTHNGCSAPHCPGNISKALALLLFYRKRNADVTRNLALYYLSMGSEPDRVRHLATAKLWFSQYCPDLNFYDMSKCISNKMNQYKWIKQIKS